MIRLSSFLILSCLVISCSSSRDSIKDPQNHEASVQGRFRLISRRCMSISEVHDGLNFRAGDSVIFHFDRRGRYSIKISQRGEINWQQGRYRNYGNTLLMTDDYQLVERPLTVQSSPQGNYLTVTSQDFDEGFCPPGDRLISVLERIQ